MARVAIPIVQPVIFILGNRPPILFMSCWPAMAWIADPAPRKSRALKNAWVIRWNTPAT